MGKILVFDNDTDFIKTFNQVLANSDIEFVPFSHESYQDLKEISNQVKAEIKDDAIALMINIDFSDTHKGLELIQELRRCDMDLPIIFTHIEDECSLYDDPRSLVIYSDGIYRLSRQFNSDNLQEAVIYCVNFPHLDADELRHISERFCTDSGIMRILLDDLNDRIRNIQNTLDSLLKEIMLHPLIIESSPVKIRFNSSKLTQSKQKALSTPNTNVNEIKRSFDRLNDHRLKGRWVSEVKTESHS